MSRYYVIPGCPISVAYGYDPSTGVVLSVRDKRLQWDREASAKVNAVAKKMSGQDVFNGSYFDLHTGKSGFGIKVDDETMATYLRRYGVPEDMVASLLNINAVNRRG